MQALTVSLIVAAAAGYAAWLLMPRRMRRWLIALLMVVAPSRRALLARLEADAENSGCGSCKGCAADGQAPAPRGPAKIEVHRRERA